MDSLRHRMLTCAALVLASGCLPPPPTPVTAFLPMPEEVLRIRGLLAEGRTQLRAPVRVVFDWDVREPGLRSGGRGVARLEPPYRARLDLFTERGETVLRAALINDELRLPEGAPGELIPPPALFWSSLGIFHPGSGYAPVEGWQAQDGAMRLTYEAQERRRLVYRLDDSGRMASLDLLHDGEIVDQVLLSQPWEEGFPSQATYRNLADFRELTLTLDEVRTVESYPSYIWFPQAVTGKED